MLMEQDPVNVFSPWNSFNLGTTLHSKENNLLNESDIFLKKSLFSHAPSNTPSYRHSDSSSPMSWSEVDNSSTSTGSRLSGIYDNGYSQDISNLWNKLEKDTNSGNLGLDHLKELASKDLPSYGNLYDRDNGESITALNAIGPTTTTSSFNPSIFGCFDSGQKVDNFLLTDSTQANTDNASLLKDILQQPDCRESSSDSAYWSGLCAIDSYGLNDLGTIELSLSNSSNALTSSFNPLPTDPNAQKNFIENLKRLRDLNELTAELNLNPSLDQPTPLYDNDGQFSPKNQSISQNLSPAFEDIFSMGMEGGFSTEKLLSNCNTPANQLETCVMESHNNFGEKMFPSRPDLSHNRFMLGRNEPNYGPLFPKSNLKINGINAPIPSNVDTWQNKSHKIPNTDLFLPNVEIANNQDNFGFKDHRKNYSLPGLPDSGIAANSDMENRFKANIPFNEQLHAKESNAFVAPPAVKPPNYGQGHPFASGRNVDGSFLSGPPFRPAPPTFPNANCPSRPLRPYPPPSVEFGPPRHGISHELHQCIEECCEQHRQLECERKESEGKLSNDFPGRKISFTSNLPIPRLPPAPSRVDRLIIDNFREHSKVITLIGVMQDLGNSEVHHVTLKTMALWHVAILQVQDKRNREIISAFNCRGFTPVNKYDYDMHSLVVALHTLSSACRHARTALFCAVTLMATATCTQHLTIAASIEAATTTDESEDEDPFEFILKSRDLRLADGGPHKKEPVERADKEEQPAAEQCEVSTERSQSLDKEVPAEVLVNGISAKATSTDDLAPVE